MRHLGHLIAFAFLLVVSSCSRSSNFFAPTDSVLSDQVSPDGHFAVTVFERDCGATTDFSTLLAMRRADQKPNADRGRIFAASGRHAVDVMWINSTSVVVKCSAKSSDIVKSETVSGSVSIRYCYETL